MVLGFNEYYNDLINEAKSPEELMKLLTYQFVDGKGVPLDVLKQVFSVDPTKKKTYTRWVLGQWSEENAKYITNVAQNGTLKKVFEYFKERATATDDAKHGLNLVDMHSLKEAIDMLPDTDPIFGEISDDPEAENYELVYDTPTWKICVPHTFKADEKLGRGCRWCTAGAYGNGDYYFKRYSSEGPLWINFDLTKPQYGIDGKEYPYTRYQFLFEYDHYRGEMKDIHNDDINKYDIPEEVKEFYASQDKRYGEYWEESDEDDYERRLNEFKQERINSAIVINDKVPGHSLRIMLGNSFDDYEAEEYNYFVYCESDDTDPVSDYYINPDDWQVSSQDTDFESVDGMSAALVKTIRGEVLFFLFRTDRYYGYWDVACTDGVLRLEQNVALVVDGEYNEVFAYNGEESEVVIFEDDGVDSSSIRKIAKVDISNKFGINNLFEVVYNNDTHTLATFKKDKEEFKIFASGEIPVDGQFFWVYYSRKNKLPYVQGKFGKHWLIDDENNDEVEFNDNLTVLCDGLGKYENLLVVKDMRKGQNILDKSTKTFLLDKWYVIIDYENWDPSVDEPFVDLYPNKNTSERCVYDFENRKFLTDFYYTDNFRFKPCRFGLDTGRLINDDGVCIFDYINRKFYSTDGHFIECITNDLCVVKKLSNNGSNVPSIKIWKYRDEEEVNTDFVGCSRIVDLHDRGNASVNMILFTGHNDWAIFDANKCEYLVTDIDFVGTVGKHNEFYFTKQGNAYILVVEPHEYKFEKIKFMAHSYARDITNCNKAFITEDNVFVSTVGHGLYFCKDIDCKNVIGLHFDAQNRFMVCFEFPGNKTVGYNIGRGDIDIREPLGWSGVNDKSEAIALLSPQISQIQESFKRWLNKISDL